MKKLTTSLKKKLLKVLLKYYGNRLLLYENLSFTDGTVFIKIDGIEHICNYEPAAKNRFEIDLFQVRDSNSGKLIEFIKIGDGTKFIPSMSK